MVENREASGGHKAQQYIMETKEDKRLAGGTNHIT
jgi:hypothetical protein